MSSTDHSPTDPPRNLAEGQEALGFTAKNASLTLLAAAIGQIGEAIVITDTSGTVQYVNPAFTKITGYSAEEAIGQHTRFLKSHRQDPVFYQKLWQTILAGEVWRGELINRRKDGTHYTEEMSITPVRDAGGAITNFIAIKQDVTAHRATEAALENSEQKLESVQQIALLGSWELDVQTSEVRGSAGFFRIFDYAPGTAVLPLSSLMDAVPAPDRERVDQTLANTIQTHEPFDLEHGVVRRDGTIRVVRSRGQLLGEQGGGPARLVGTSHDITDQRLAHQKLRQSEEKFRSLVANVPDVIWTATADGRIHYISPNVEKVFGFTPEEIYEKRAELWFGRIHLDDCQLIAEELQQLFAEGQPFDVDYRVQRKDGQWIWVHDRAYRTYEKDGVRYADGVSSDITERKRVEKELWLTQFSVEHASDAIFWADSYGHFVHVNEAACRSIECSREELLSLSVSGISPPYTKEVWGTYWAELKTRGSMTFEAQHKTRQGRVFPVDLTANYQEFDGKEYCFAFARDISERKRAEDALTASEKRYRLLFERNLAGVLRTTLEGRILEINQAAAGLFGYDSPEEVLALQVTSLYHTASDREEFLTRLKSEKSLTNYEGEFRRKDGEPVWVLENVSLDDGILESTLIDITERKLAEEELYRSRQMLQTILDAIPQRVFWKDRNCIYLGCNRALATDAGLNHPAEIIGKNDFDLDWKETAEVYRADDKLVMEQGSAKLGYEEMQDRPDGGRVWLRTSKLPLWDREGKVIGVLGTYEDITERKRAEEDIRQSGELLRIVLDSIPEAVYGIDMQGKCTFCNPSCLRLLGYEEAAELLGRNMHDLIHHTRQDGTYYPVEECHIFEAFRQGHGIHIDNEVIWRRDGTSFPAEYWSDPMHRGVEAIGTVVTFVNIAERKRGEQFLLEAKEAAEAANRAKSQFLANMSHEIRTPMNGVIGVAGLLLDTVLTPEQRQYAELVRISGEALMAVINDILDFSKIEARKLTLETTDFDLRTVMENAVAVLAIKAAEKGLALGSELKPGTPWLLRGDPGRLRQILMNLVGNAVKFTQHGGVSIWAALDVEEGNVEEDQAEDGGNARLRFTITDSGIGFRQEQASALFEPFVQADGSSTRRHGGTGLGLTISKQLAELMGGQIGVESQEGKGSTFWFTAVFEKQPEKQLPVKALTMTSARGSLAAAAAAPALQPPAAVPASRQARILLAEDNPVSQAVALAMLTKLGYHADLVSSGVEALQALRQADYDLVLMDCGLPEMDGYEATRRIRDGGAGTRNPLIPIIAITADAMSGDRDKCLAVGMSDYVAKPVEVRELGDMLGKWLEATSASPVNAPTDRIPAELEPVFNPREFLARLMDDQDLASKVVAAFLEDAPRQLRALQGMIEKGDAEGAQRRAHRLKGAAATLSAEALRALCAESQEAAAANDLERASILLPRMQEQFERLKTTLQQSGWCS